MEASAVPVNENALEHTSHRNYNLSFAISALFLISTLLERCYRLLDFFVSSILTRHRLDVRKARNLTFMLSKEIFLVRSQHLVQSTFLRLER